MRLMWTVIHFNRIESIFISEVLRIASFFMSIIGKPSAQRDVRLKAMATERMALLDKSADYAAMAYVVLIS